ncbi:hypothetical protein ACUN9Y_21410 [Halomonas sp. V046]|uniref:hypothetical protein n=1 Tax=Halomonas sp. V046 TaxID=3459611 RepID=UPI0040441CEB
MKRQFKVLSIVLGLSVSAGVVAAPGHQETTLKVLDEGVSQTQQLRGGPARYSIPVARAGKLYLSSEHLASESSQSVAIGGVLYDEDGRLVASDTDKNGHFTMVEDVQAGTYTLEVTGQALGSVEEVSGRYTLHVGME